MFRAGAMISVSAMAIQCMPLFGWVSRPHLPIVFFFEFRLFSIVSTFGIGLTLDGPTKLVSRPNVARVCVEVGLLKENLQNRVWIGSTLYGSLAINCLFLNT